MLSSLEPLSPGRARHRTWLIGLVVVGAVIGHARCGDSIRRLLRLPTSGVVAPRSAGARVATWNLRNFPFRSERGRPDEGPHDLERMRATLRALDADVIAVQEVLDDDALRTLAAGRTVLLSRAGGRGHQRVGLLLNPDRVELLDGPREHDSITAGGRVRPALSAYVRVGDLDFHVVVVHLKASPHGYELRTQQWATLVEIVEQLRQDPGPGAGDRDVVILGDFNTTGPPGRDAVGAREQLELAALDRALTGAGLRRLDNRTGCSAYWEGSRRDAWKEPSWLDQIVVPAEWLPSGTGGGTRAARSVGHCARHECAPLRSSSAYPEADFATMSDHCPVLADLHASG